MPSEKVIKSKEIVSLKKEIYTLSNKNNESEIYNEHLQVKVDVLSEDLKASLNSIEMLKRELEEKIKANKILKMQNSEFQRKIDENHQDL